MATSSIFPFSFLLLFLALSPLTLASATSPSSSVAFAQLNFWSKNVVNVMPKSVLSKLSPLSQQDSDYLASLLSKQSYTPDAKFCSMANLACETKLQQSLMISNEYNRYNDINSIHLSDDQADPSSFFRLSTLVYGNKVRLPNLNDQIPPRALLPSQIASKISTTSSNEVKKLFPELFTSPTTRKTIETSILYCGAPALKDEVKRCVNSLEDMIQFSKKALNEKQLISLAIKSTEGSEKELEIGKVKQFDAEKVVSCHEVFFPFATYFCHLVSSYRLYAVDIVEPLTKAPVNKIFAICHMDTSQWPAEHVAFKILKSSPGRGEACHWFTKIDIAWIGIMEKNF